MILGTLSYIAYFFYPLAFEEQMKIDLLLEHNGYESSAYIPPEVYIFIFGTKVGTAFGMFLYQNRSRLVFITVMIVPLLLSVFGGFYVVPVVESTLLDISNICFGAVLAMSYFSSINSQFR